MKQGAGEGQNKILVCSLIVGTINGDKDDRKRKAKGDPEARP